MKLVTPDQNNGDLVWMVVHTAANADYIAASETTWEYYETEDEAIQAAETLLESNYEKGDTLYVAEITRQVRP